MNPWTYDTLSAELVAWTEDEFEDFEAAIPTIIGAAEDLITKDLELGILDKEDAAQSTAIGVTTVTKPADCLTINEIYVAGVPLARRSESYVSMFGLAAVTGIPLYFHDKTTTAIILAPTPNAVLAVRYRYVGRPAGLTPANQTTWIGTNVPDLLWFACLSQAEAFLGDEGRKTSWMADYESRLPRDREEKRALKRDSGDRLGAQPPPVPRPLP